MHFLIENSTQFEKLTPQSECFVQVIPLSYAYHPKLTSISLIYYRSIDKGYVFSIKHSETESLELQSVLDFISKHDKVFVLDKKFHSYFLNPKNLVDVFFCLKENANRADFKTSIQMEYELKYFNRPDVNALIPVSKHYEHLENVFEYYKGNFFRCENWEDLSNVIDSYFYVENNSIGVNESFFDVYTVNNKKHSYDGRGLYTHYNMYNQTGRPTNTFNGVNFVAIPKDEEHRSCIIPQNEYFVEYDFDGYHVRLIANKLGVKLPETSIHEYLGKQYFNKEELTEEDYKVSKTITFRQLYGGVMEEYSHIELFKKMGQFIKDLWESYDNNKFIKLPTGSTLYYNKEMTPLKVFNYYVQNMETKNNSDRVKLVREILEGKKTKLVLITYDAFLFDFDCTDGKDLLLSIKSALETGGYPTKHKYGKNYFLQQS